VPSVVSSVDGCVEILGDGHGGSTARPGDESDFQTKLGDLIGSPERRALQGASARERVVRDYDARTMTAVVEGTYRKLLGAS
jgi:glycosyltransferase involved in cell wall biosynthesis